MAIEIKKIDEYKVAFILTKGSYEKIPETLGEVVGWLMTKDVEIQMPIYGLYYNSPLEVSEDELEWEVGAAFLGDLEGEGRVQIKTVPEHMAVSTVFKGPFSEANSVYGSMLEFASKEGYEIGGPVLESYLNSPDEVPESELLTEVQFPVVQK
ncbi:MAG TPA: GyrI-like domain-containing protein [Methanobacterium sp.]|jgi:effector-binding domain-containing protein|nr:GyrI-like domain-containing protein [Methanobacterium sp.]HOI39267.1 GyrI-like domain-containing protein [Methanobacterium sp.]